MATSVFDLVGKIVLQGGDKVNKELKDIDGNADKSGGKLSKFGGVLGVVGGAVGAGAVALGGLAVAVGKVGLSYNAMQEQSMVTWTTLLGTQAEAKKQLEAIADFAKKTPFETEHVDAMAKYMHNAGLEGKALFDELMKISDTASAFNIPASEAKELTRQMSQVRQAGVAYTEDLNIMADRGIPIYKAISEQLGVTVADVKKMAGEGKITSEIYLAAFDNIAAGVKGASDAQSQTMNGMISTLKDNVTMLAGTLTAGVFEKAKGFMAGAVSLVEQLNAGLAAGGIQGAFEAVFGTIDKGEGHLSAFGEAFKYYVDYARDLWNLYATEGMAITKELVETWDALAEWFNIFWSTYGKSITTELKAIFDAVTTITKAAFKIIADVIKLALNLIQGDWKGAWENIKSILTTVSNAIRTAVEYVFGLIVRILKGMFGNMLTDAKNGINNIKTAIVNTLNALVGQVKTIAANIVTSLANGIRNGAKKVVDAASSLGRQALNKFKSIFDIGSPSRVMTYFGEMLGEGLTGGLSDSEGGVLSQAQSIATQLLDTLRQQFSPSLNLSGVTEGMGAGGLTGLMGAASGGLLKIEVPLYVNGREVARAVTDDIDYQLERKRQVTSRSRGLSQA